MLWERVDRAGIDFAEDISVLSIPGFWTVEKIGIPDDWKVLRCNAQRPLHSRDPIFFKFTLESLKFRLGRRVIEARPWLGGIALGCTCGRWEKGVDCLMAE